MLLGGDLRLLCSVVVLVVGWLLARRKWRRAAARREEIRRLMAFASEEEARVELEAAAGYRSYGSALDTDAVTEEPVIKSGLSPGRQLQYQCEVCFSPTTTRCKQCKAVRYCSRKCQVFHWRQGHKDECQSFSTDQDTDAGAHFYPKEFKQGEILTSKNDVIGIDVMDSAKPVKLSSGEHMFSSKISPVLGKNNDTGTGTSDNWKETDINVKARVQSLPDEFSSSTISKGTSVTLDSDLKDGNKYDGQSTTMNVESIKPLLSGKPSVTSPRNGIAASSVSDQVKPGCIDIDGKSKSSTSSECNATGSEENSISEPSSPSSDFWGGTVEPTRHKINHLHEHDVNMLNSHSLFPPSDRTNGHVEMSRPGKTRVLRDDPSLATPTRKESMAVPKVTEDGLNSRGSQVFSAKLSGKYGGNSKEEAKLPSSNVSNEHVSPGHARKHAADVNSSQLAPKQLDHEIGQTHGTSDTLKREQNDSSRLGSSGAPLSSSASTRKPPILDVLSVENERSQGDASCSLGSSLYVRSAISVTNPSSRVVDQRKASNLIRHGSLGAGNGIMGRYEGSFPYDVFVKLYNWNKVELSPCGLINCGNSCYANSVLQCLAFTPPLTAYFLQGLHAKSCQRKEWCFTCEFEALVKKALDSNYPLSPARIMSQMQRVASHLGNGKEEDAHEFLRYAIEAMQFVCLKEAGVNAPSSWDEETTLLGLTFGGHLQSKIECMRCRGKSKQHERIMDLTVEIGGEIGTLEDALRQFTHSEILDGENKYLCGRCNSYEKAKKKLRVLEAPNVLTIALKRFQTGKFGKLNKAVKFPEILNLAPFMSGTSDKSPIYQLYGVVVHRDLMNATFSGHYVCYVKNNRGRWFKADDSMVKGVELEKVLSNDAYMLFYARCSPRAPRLIKGVTVPTNPRKATSIPKSHPVEPWDVYRNHAAHHPNRSNLEDETSSEHSSSMFSESGSNSTESSNRESTSTTDDMLDQSLGDMGNCWGRQWRSTSDSDTPSQSSSSSPLCARRSPLAELDRYSSDAEEHSSFCSANTSSNMDSDGFWERASSKVEVSALLCSRSNKESSRVCSSSCRDNESNSRLGINKSSDNVKGVYLRRTMS